MVSAEKEGLGPFSANGGLDLGWASVGPRVPNSKRWEEAPMNHKLPGKLISSPAAGPASPNFPLSEGGLQQTGLI